MPSEAAAASVEPVRDRLRLIPDFGRDVFCLLGLPFDAVSEMQAEQLMRDAVASNRRCFVSTPNLNFAVACARDAAFRASVLHSDLSVADGMPLVWAARLLGIPLPGRVAGSALVERLRAPTHEPLKVFFFGGADGVAARACERLNATAGGLRCVGFDAPGFGPVDGMSGDDRIQRINASGADFVIVSLGAQKGQAWIERNRARLQAPLVSHLGAVVNFVAGSVARAPRWMQHAGLEWLWRIKEEPSLWLRYLNDGIAFAHLFATRLVPYAIHLRRHAPTPAQLADARIETRFDGEGIEVRLSGAWSAGNLSPLRSALADATDRGAMLHIDLAQVVHGDAAFVALLCLLWGAGTPCRIQHVSAPVRRVLRYCCAEYILEKSGNHAAAPLREGCA